MNVKKKQNSTTRQKKVLFVATVDSHILNFHVPYLKMLQEMGYETHVATNGHDNIPYCDHRHTICMERSPYKINNLKAVKQMRRLMEREHFDLVHCHTPMGAVVTRLAAKKARKQHKMRVIYTAHGFHFYKGAPLINWLLFYPIEKYLAKYTDTLITINQEDYSRAKKKFSDRCRDIQYVPGVGLDTSRFDFKMTAKEKLQLRTSLGLKKDDFVIIYPAELSKRKRQIWLIKTLKNFLEKHPDVHLLLPGKDSLNYACQKLCNDLCLGAQIHCLGFRNDIPQLLAISDMAVSTAKQEGLPVNIMEAMYMGLPIVASDCRGNRDLAAKNRESLVALGDRNSFVQKVSKHHRKRAERSKSSLKLSADFLYENISRQMKDIYTRKLRICITNAYTWRNKGDAGILLATIQLLKELYGADTIFDILSFSPKEDAMHYCEDPQVEGVFSNVLNPHPYNPTSTGKIVAMVKLFYRAVAISVGIRLARKYTINKNSGINAINKADIIVVCGGGFLGGDKLSSMMHLYQMNLNTFFHKPTFLVGASVEPMKNKIIASLTASVLKKMDFVLARESITDNLLKTILPDQKHACMPDMAFALDCAETVSIPKFIMDAKNSKKLVGVTLRNCDFPNVDDKSAAKERYISSVAHVMEQYIDSQDFRFVFIPQVITSTRDDASVAAEVKKRLPKKMRSKFIINQDDWSPYEIKAAIGECDYFIGTRMHSNIFALSSNVPTVAIAYEKKTNGIMGMVGLDKYVIDINEISPELLSSMFKTLIGESDAIKEHLRVEIPTIKANIRTALEDLCQGRN